MKKSGLRFLVLCLFSSFLIHCQPSLQDVKKSRKLYNMGIRQAGQGKLRESLVILLNAEKLNPNDYWVQEAIGGVFLRLGHPQKAVKYFQRGIKLKPKSPRGWNNLGTVYMALKQWKKAAKIFRVALSNILYQTPCYAQFNLGRSYHHLGQKKKGIELLQKGITNCPRLCQGYRLLGLTALEQTQYSLAEKAFLQLTLRCKKFPPGYYWLGKSQWHQKKVQQAKKNIQTCLKMGVAKTGFKLHSSCKDLSQKIHAMRQTDQGKK